MHQQPRQIDKESCKNKRPVKRPPEEWVILDCNIFGTFLSEDYFEGNQWGVLFAIFTTLTFGDKDTGQDAARQRNYNEQHHAQEHPNSQIPLEETDTSVCFFFIALLLYSSNSLSPLIWSALQATTA